MFDKSLGFDNLIENIISLYQNVVNIVVADSMLMKKNTGSQSCCFCKKHVNESP